ncbi:hypothetical protein DL96DRAFT_141028 [Flagelloscypha sp. PMI_526]|nr:hypothetical protein DL96DRAFT_141028 [Flagelloscypha sp. PMI_526]
MPNPTTRRNAKVATPNASGGTPGTPRAGPSTIPASRPSVANKGTKRNSTASGLGGMEEDDRTRKEGQGPGHSPGRTGNKRVKTSPSLQGKPTPTPKSVENSPKPTHQTQPPQSQPSQSNQSQPQSLTLLNQPLNPPPMSQQASAGGPGGPTAGNGGDAGNSLFSPTMWGSFNGGGGPGGIGGGPGQVPPSMFSLDMGIGMDAGLGGMGGVVGGGGMGGGGGMTNFDMNDWLQSDGVGGGPGLDFSTG